MTSDTMHTEAAKICTEIGEKCQLKWALLVPEVKHHTQQQGHTCQ